MSQWNKNKPENPFQTMTSLWIGNIYMNLDMHRNLQDIWSWNFIYTLQKKRHFTEKETKKVREKRSLFAMLWSDNVFLKTKGIWIHEIQNFWFHIKIVSLTILRILFTLYRERDTLRRMRHFMENETLYGERDKKVWKERSLEASAFKW